MAKVSFPSFDCCWRGHEVSFPSSSLMLEGFLLYLKFHFLCADHIMILMKNEGEYDGSQEMRRDSDDEEVVDAGEGGYGMRSGAELNFSLSLPVSV